MPDRSAPVPYSGTSTVAPEVQSPNDYMTVQANPEQMGAGVGQAEQKLGATGEQVGNEVGEYAIRAATLATQAQTDDKIANVYAPRAAALSGAYYSTKNLDAVKGYQPYIDGLHQNMQDVLATSTSPLETQLLSQYMARHVAQEVDGASRHQNQEMTAYEDKSSADFVNAQSDGAINAGSNPDVINQKIAAGNARIQLQASDRGLDPTSQDGQSIIQQQQADFTGKTVKGVVASALQRGDIDFANSFYANNSKAIAGPEYVDVGKMLHAENMNYIGDANATAAQAGAPLPPHPGGIIVTNVKSAVARAAQSAGADPNAALTIAGLESSYGQNVGSRGDIGQTGKPAATLDDQAKNLVDAQVQAQKAADTAVGGKAEPWQGYVCYQQGVAGGPALIKAAADNPNAKAVDVLSPFYSNPATALSAIKGNGGNATMSAGQFLDFIKDKYTTEYGRASCVTNGPDGKPVALGDAIIAPHVTGGVAMQPASNPVQALKNFDDTYPDALQRLSAIPEHDERVHSIESLNQKRNVFLQGAAAWKNNFSDKVNDIVTQPDFTSMNDPRLTPEIRTAMADDHTMLNNARAYAKNNLRESLNLDTSANSDNGYDTIMRTLEPNDNSYPNRISNQDHLDKLLGKPDGTGINVKDYTDAKPLLEASDPWKDFLLTNMKQITNANGNVDGQGQQRAMQWFSRAQAAKKSNDKMGDKGAPETEFIQKLQDQLTPPAPSRMQQIQNYANQLLNGTKQVPSMTESGGKEVPQAAPAAVQTATGANGEKYILQGGQWVKQ